MQQKRTLLGPHFKISFRHIFFKVKRSKVEKPDAVPS